MKKNPKLESGAMTLRTKGKSQGICWSRSVREDGISGGGSRDAIGWASAGPKVVFTFVVTMKLACSQSHKDVTQNQNTTAGPNGG